MAVAGAASEELQMAARARAFYRQLLTPATSRTMTSWDGPLGPNRKSANWVVLFRRGPARRGRALRLHQASAKNAGWPLAGILLTFR